MDKYLIENVEEALMDRDDDFTSEELDFDGDKLVVWGWHVYVPELDLVLRSGFVMTYYEDEKCYMPDYDLTLIYNGKDKKPGEWAYYESDGFAVSLANYLRKDINEVYKLECELVIPESGGEVE